MFLLIFYKKYGIIEWGILCAAHIPYTVFAENRIKRNLLYGGKVPIPISISPWPQFLYYTFTTGFQVRPLYLFYIPTELEYSYF